MTRFAEPAVYQCPACENYFLRNRFFSVNFSGTRDWSDGAPTAWWRQEPLVRCHGCRALIWIDDIEPVGTLPHEPPPIGWFERTLARRRGDPKGRLRKEQEWKDVPDTWKCAKRPDSIDIDDVAFLLSKPNGLGRDNLLWLRRYIWWGLNDRYRAMSDGSPIPNVPTMAEYDERTNMQAILDLLELDELKPRDLITKGEVLRLLGRFDEAVAVLRAVPPDGYNEIRASKIETLARRGDMQVRLLGS